MYFDILLFLKNIHIDIVNYLKIKKKYYIYIYNDKK